MTLFFVGSDQGQSDQGEIFRWSENLPVRRATAAKELSNWLFIISTILLSKIKTEPSKSIGELKILPCYLFIFTYFTYLILVCTILFYSIEEAISFLSFANFGKN